MIARRWLFLLCCFLALACKKREEWEFRLTDDEEVKAFTAELGRRVAENQRRSCERPELRGEPAPGKAGLDMIAAIEGSGEAEPCRTAAGKGEEIVERLERALVAEGPPAGWPARSNALLLATPTSGAAAGALAACSAAVEILRRAVTHRDACSPYLPGVRGSPRYQTFVLLSGAATAFARDAIAAGDLDHGFDLAADLFRFAQDLGRGAALLEAMIAAFAQRLAAAAIELALHQPGRLGSARLDRWERELAQLAATFPTFESHLSAEMLAMAMPLLPLVSPDRERQGIGRVGDDSVPPEVHPGDYAVLSWISLERAFGPLREVCGEESTGLACSEALERLAKQESRRVDAGEVLLASLGGKVAREAVRESILESLVSIARPAYARYVARIGDVAFALAALRLVAAHRKLAEERGACGDAALFETPPLAALREDPYGREPMGIEAVAGGFVIRPGAGLRARADRDGGPAIFLRCE